MATATVEADLEVRVPAYHAGQVELQRIARDARVTLGIVGRRWGKTFFGVNEKVEKALDACDPKSHRYQGPGDYGWFAPSYKLSNIAWDEFDKWFAPLEKSSSRTERVLELVCGCRLWFLSTDNPTAGRGRGFRDATVDEGAWIVKSTYENVILPTLADSNGPLLTITTPAGRRGWVHEEYQRAVNKADGYAFLQRPSTDNPNPNIRKYVDFRRSNMSETAFAQEFLAQFTEDASALFKNIDAAIGGQVETPQPEAQYLIGVDLGKSIGRTAAEVLRLSGGPPYQLADELVMFKDDWPSQVRSLAELARKWNRAPMVVDATGLGGPVCDDLRAAGVSVRPITLLGGRVISPKPNSIRKVDLLDRLATAIGNKAVRIPAKLGAGDGDLRRELESFAIDVDDEGTVTYESRSGHGGGHGDRVIALALAVHGMPKAGTATVVSRELTTEEIEDLGGEDIMGEKY